MTLSDLRDEVEVARQARITREELFALLEDVLTELRDPRFSGRDHHDIGTYNRKCRGPLCSKANRDYGRERYRKQAQVPDQEHHKPTVRTRWDDILEMMPTRLVLAS